MKIINKPKDVDKTTELIMKSYKNKIPIICINYATAKYIRNKAKKMRLEIPDPIPFDDIKGVVIDFK